MPARKHWFWISGVGIAMSMGAGLVQAQEPNKNARTTGSIDDQEDMVGEAVDLETIIVSGQLQERSLQENPTSVFVHTGPALEQRPDQDLYDVLSRTPNVTSAFGEKGFAIRGIDQRGAGGGSGQLVNITVDGVNLPSNQATFFGPYSIWDLDQIEVYRGPQSTQRGRNALGGAIIVRSQDPLLGTWDAKARVSAAELGFTRMAGAVNLPLAGDTLAARFAVEDIRSDGWVSNPTRNEDDYDAREQQMFRGKLLWQPNDKLRGRFLLTRSDNFGGEDYVVRDRFPSERINESDAAASEGSTHDIAGMELRYQGGDSWHLFANSTYYEQDYERIEDIDNSAAPAGLLEREGRDRSFNQELRLHWRRNNLQGVVGVYYETIDSDIVDVLAAPGSLIGLPPEVRINRTSRTNNDITNQALFGEVDWAVSERMSMVVGLRYDTEEADRLLRQEAVLTPPVIEVPQSPDEAQPADYSALLPKISLRYDWASNLRTMFTVQRAYRAGGFSLSPVSGEGGEFDPEFATNFELALRSEWLDGRVHANLNLFYLDWSDQHVSVQGSTGLPNDFFVTNAGESEVYGAEVDLQWRASRNLLLYLSLGHAHTEFTDFNNGGEDFAGRRFGGNAEWSGAAGLSYRYQERWLMQLDAFALSSYFSDNENTPLNEVSGRGLVNLSVGYDMPRWSARLFARNLLDRDYITQAADNIVRTGEPRVAGIELTARW